MKLINVGVIPTEIPESWTIELLCTTSILGRGCGAKLQVQRSDIQLRKWVKDCGYKGMKYYFAYILCPCCDVHVPVSKKDVHPYLLQEWKRETGFSGYVVPCNKHSELRSW
ncbi:MAG: hypothetical protein JWN64_475 [Parcubacteria group bacterium]|nr:hypothetical protein [Parcubacteria group bacterium]